MSSKDLPLPSSGPRCKQNIFYALQVFGDFLSKKKMAKNFFQNFMDDLLTDS